MGGKVRIKVAGFNQSRLIGALSGKGISIEKINRKNAGEMTFTVRAKDAEKTFAILTELCYNYTVITRSGPKTMLRKAASRAGLMFGLIIFTGLLGLFYGFIWHVEITGNEKVDSLVIERALKDCGIAVGKQSKNLDRNSIRNVVNAVDGILESSVEIIGTTVRVEVVEDTDYQPPVKDSYENIVSKYDAEVTRIIASSGTAKAVKGQVVAKGAVIISAERTDTAGNVFPSPAKGEAYGNVAFSESQMFSLKSVEKERTGKKYAVTDYTLFGLKIKGKHAHGFAEFETESKTSYVFDNLFLPLKMSRTVYYETATQEVTYEKEYLIEQIKNALIEKNVIKAGGSTVECSTHLQTIDENNYRLTVYIVAEMKIT